MMITTLLLALAALGAAALWQGLRVRAYTIATHKVDAPVRLAVLTDLHSTMYGKAQHTLLEAIRAQAPDAVLLAGDIADDRASHEGTKQLLASLGREYPCYYVSGNHECWSGELAAIKEMIRSYGVTVLEGEAATLRVRGQRIRICGVDDPAAFDSAQGWQAQLAACSAAFDGQDYAVLLSHRPERVAAYRAAPFDLVTAGHAHGGQVRLPGLINGLYAPDQGWFPAYAGGLYDLEGTTMIVSRGLARSALPRVCNPPELVVVDITPV
nr:metallophosphoesterase [Maliibacterium massiliense]